MNTWGMARGDLYVLSFEDAYEKVGYCSHEDSMLTGTRVRVFYVQGLLIKPQRGNPGPDDTYQYKTVSVYEKSSFTFLVTHPRHIKKGKELPGITEYEKVWKKNVETGEFYPDSRSITMKAKEGYHRGFGTLVQSDGTETMLYLLLSDHTLNNPWFTLKRKNDRG